MKEKYDFGKKIQQKVVKESLDDSVPYDFITENAWASVAKFGADVANVGYRTNALKGAGAGAVVGGIGNMAKNMTKRDDDPTKRGMISSMVRGAAGGATAGAALGVGARFAARTSLGMKGIKSAGEKAIEDAQNTAVEKLGADAAEDAIKKAKDAALADTVRTMNSGTKAGWFSNGNYWNKGIGWNQAGELRKTNMSAKNGWRYVKNAEGDISASNFSGSRI